jgi:hypothetical protein
VVSCACAYICVCVCLEEEEESRVGYCISTGFAIVIGEVLELQSVVLLDIGLYVCMCM